ncbi:MAG: hypothetical protein M1835_003364 [Candelina submexicana]|nr:MAG: hypothetical protein M1835_003364 [Candelina submexicana]
MADDLATVLAARPPASTATTAPARRRPTALQFSRDLKYQSCIKCLKRLAKDPHHVCVVPMPGQSCETCRKGGRSCKIVDPYFNDRANDLLDRSAALVDAPDNKASRAAGRTLKRRAGKLAKEIDARSRGEKVNKRVDEELLAVGKRIADTLDLLLACELKKNNWPARPAAAKPKAPDDDESSEPESDGPGRSTPGAGDGDERMDSQ